MMARLQTLARGANVSVPDTRATAVVAWEADAEAIVYACMVQADGKMRSPGDLVARGQLRTAEGALAILEVKDRDATLAADFTRVPHDISKIVFCLVMAEGEKRNCGSIRASITISATGVRIAGFELPDDASSEAAAILGELYRRNGSWKFRAVGQGFKGGVVPLATFIGCTRAEMEAVAARAPAAPAPPPPVSPTVAARERVAQEHASTAPPAPPAPQRPPSVHSADEGQPTDRKASFAFTSRGWVIGERGVVPAPGEKRRGAAAYERELLDLRSDAQGQLWPALFAHQPLTGEKLPPMRASLVTVGRSLGPMGLPELEAVCSIDPRTRADEEVPEGARLFASGGAPPRLIAINPADGHAWWKAPLSSKWVPLGRCPRASALPIFAAGAVGTASGVFYAADDGLVHLLPEQRAEFRRLPTAAPPIAPPAAVGGSVLLPVASDAGVGLVVRTLEGEVRQLPVPGAQAPQGPLGAPVANSEAGICFWVGTGGYLVFEEDLQGVTAAWRPWPEGVEGVPFLRPFRGRNGRFWAMCVEASRDGAVRGRALACAMTPAGSKEKHVLLGPHVSAGSQTFRGRSRHAEPWQNAAEEINLGFDYEGRWLLPFLRIGGRHTIVGLVDPGTTGAGGGVREFVFREGNVAAREVTLALHTDNGPLNMLAQSFRISSTDELEFFLDSERLCIHHIESHQCASWSVSFSH